MTDGAVGAAGGTEESAEALEERRVRLRRTAFGRTVGAGEERAAVLALAELARLDVAESSALPVSDPATADEPSRPGGAPRRLVTIGAALVAAAFLVGIALGSGLASREVEPRVAPEIDAVGPSPAPGMLPTPLPAEPSPGIVVSAELSTEELLGSEPGADDALPFAGELRRLDPSSIRRVLDVAGVWSVWIARDAEHGHCLLAVKTDADHGVLECTGARAFARDGLVLNTGVNGRDELHITWERDRIEARLPRS